MTVSPSKFLTDSIMIGDQAQDAMYYVAHNLEADKRLQLPWVWSSDSDGNLPDLYFHAFYTTRILKEKENANG